jgi:glycosyltransferase involved in cell wall biosynthesis
MEPAQGQCLMPRKPRLLFLINSLNPGGAERQLGELVRNLDLDRFDVQLVVYYDSPRGADHLWHQLASRPGISLTSLHKRRGPAGYAIAIPRLLSILLKMEPDIVHGYLEGNLPLLLLGRLLHKRVVWGIRRTSSDWEKLDRVSRLLIRTMIQLSPYVDLIIFNSQAGLANHVTMGMRSGRMAVIPNGFDVMRFRPDEALGLACRGAWGLPKEAQLIGIVGRLDPVKDHPTFLRAAARLATEWPYARFVCVGGASGKRQDTLKAMATSLGIGDKVLWPGTCEDMTAVYNALSVLVLCSTDEGFPNALGEGMACGVPCVTTRVGDAVALVGATGISVDPGDDQALATAVSTLLRESPTDRADRAEAARLRICTTFSVASLASNTADMLLSLLPAPATSALPRGA